MIKKILAFLIALVCMIQAMPLKVLADGLSFDAVWNPEDSTSAGDDDQTAASLYTVTFSSGDEEEVYYVYEGMAMTFLPEPAGADQDAMFLGWYLENSRVTVPFVPHGNVELKACFAEAMPSSVVSRMRSGNFLWEDSGFYADVSVFGSHKKNQRPSVRRAGTVRGDDTHIVLEAWTVSSLKNNTKLTADAVVTNLPDLDDGESLAVYSVVNNTLYRAERENLSIGDRVDFDLAFKGADGLAVVKVIDPLAAEAAVEEIEGALYANEDIYLTGKIPGNGIIDVQPVTVSIDGEDVIAAWDIHIYANANQQKKGKTWQPAGKKVQVHFRDKAFTGELNIYHFADGTSAPEYVTTVEASDGWVEFEAESFSTYAVTRTIETTVTIGGATYRIAVTFDRSAGIPEDAGLDVEEMTGDALADYLGRTAAAMNAAGFAYGRIFDISIVDVQGEKLQPLSPVEVSVELLDAGDNTQPFTVMHFEDEAEMPEEVKADTEGNVVSFSAASFSAYAIVQGPSAVPVGIEQLSSMDALKQVMHEGFYIGHPLGYYLTDTEGVATNNAHGILKTKPAQSYPHEDAARYYLEAVEGQTSQFYLYCLKNGSRYYVQNSSNEHVYLTEDETKRTAFKVTAESGSTFSFQSTATKRYLNHWQDNNGTVFAAWTEKNAGSKLSIWTEDADIEEPFNLDGKTYGLMYWSEGIYGKAMMASPGDNGSLAAKELIVMSEKDDNTDKLFVPNDSDISMWTFEWIAGDLYALKTVTGGAYRYLNISSDGQLYLSNTLTADGRLQVVPGSGTNAGRICLKANGKTLTYSGVLANGFRTGGTAGTEWLNLVQMSELTSDYVLPYSAGKVSISDQAITNGSRIILYTRAWNDTAKKYEFYVIEHDGTLVRAYENGDEIEWLGSLLNSKLWNLVEYYWEGTNDPNNYYDLYNQYSGKFLAPQLTGSQILSDNPIGINLNGRYNGYYQSTILAWDETNYAYAGLKVENGQLVTCPRAEAMDFYFAVIEDLPVDDELTTVSTVDHTQYGLTMKIKNFGTRKEMSDFLGNDAYTNGNTTPNLLSTNLGANGYPTAENTGKNLVNLMGGGTEVNHLFISSTYNGSGYFVFDSSQNYAYLNGTDFTVYRQLGTHDKSNEKWEKHGQFLPFNNIKAGRFASRNRQNLYTATGAELPNSDPRKYERLYLAEGDPDFYYGVEIEASFTQTPNGLDAWGHDIIYEFSGDDDFWLYVDGELVIDLGGIHDALPGSVNYRTGDVNVNGTKTTLRKLFEANYKARNPGASQSRVDEYLSRYFEGTTSVFKAYSNHTMKIFYMERGAGAANLFMRFNLASIKPGTVELSKELSGIDTDVSVLAAFPYQIRYKSAPNDRTENLLFPEPAKGVTVRYKNTETDVPYYRTFTIPGTNLKYEHVFMLKPGETAVVTMPDTNVVYSMVECGVNTQVYSSVSVNGHEVTGKKRTGGRYDYSTGYAATGDRPSVKYVNTVNPAALRTLYITKRLYREDGTTPLSYEADATSFSLRLYLGTEFDSAPSSANMYSYRIRDPQNRYCRWDTDAQRLVATEWTDLSRLTPAQKETITFDTSIFGTIARIPAFFTVEVPNILAGTTFRIQERPGEIPDGYSFMKYQYNMSGYKGNLMDAAEGVQDVVASGTDPRVDVCNIRGWGLRIRKVWSDADFMEKRDPAYFAVFAKETDESLTIVPEGGAQDDQGRETAIVRQMPYGQSTLYWYFPRLPVAWAQSIDDYEIREVTLTEPTVDENGNVTGYESLEIKNEGDEISFMGRQKAESADAQFTYHVRYTRGSVAEGSQMRTDTAFNSRSGLELRKTDWEGKPLSGAAFELRDSTGTVIGTFTSDEDGLITTAFLSNDGAKYTLTETSAPQGYQGIQGPITLSQKAGVVTAACEEAYQDFCILKQEVGEAASLTLKNRPYTLKAVKVDGTHGEPLSGAVFALHRQVTVNGVTSFDLTPVAGYASLVSDAEGSIPLIDQTLPAGIYQLRELTPPAGYDTLTDYIYFTITGSGEVILGEHPEGTELKKTPAEDGSSLACVLTIRNYAGTVLSIEKQVTGDAGDLKLPFAFTLSGLPTGESYAYDKYALQGDTWVKLEGESGFLTCTKEAAAAFTLAHGQKIIIDGVPKDRDLIVTEQNGAYITSMIWNGTTTPGNQIRISLHGAAGLKVINQMNTLAPTGVTFQTLPYLILLFAGLVLLSVLGMGRKRRREE